MQKGVILIGRDFQHVWNMRTSSDLIQLASRPQKVCVAPE